MIIFIWTRKPRFFSNRRHRLLRDESFEHPVVLGQSSTYVNEFSLPSAIFIAKQFARSILRSENQEWRHAAWGPIQYAAQRVRRRCLTQNCRRVLRHTFGIVSKNPPCLMILQNLARFLPIVAKEKLRAVRDA